MIRNLAERIVEWQIKKHSLPDEERGLYQYAYEVLLNQVINVLIAILIAVLFRAPMPVFLFLASYIPLRSYCGGHHARTNGGCTAVSAVLLCIICVIYRILPSNAGVIMQPVSYIISGLLIIRFAPVENVNKLLAEEERVRYRKISRYIWFGESILLKVTVNDVEVEGDKIPRLDADNYTILNGQGGQMMAKPLSANTLKIDGIEEVYPGGKTEGYVAFFVPKDNDNLVEAENYLRY